MAFLCPVRMRRDKKKGVFIESGRSSTETKDFNHELVVGT